MSADERIERARLLYERSIFEGDAGALVLADRELDAVEAIWPWPAAGSFTRSCEIAVQAGDKLTMSDALRHLSIAEHAAGRPDKARERLEESVRIRTQLAAGGGVQDRV